MEETILMSNLILSNWDVLSLLVTNILAYYAKSPRQKFKKGKKHEK